MTILEKISVTEKLSSLFTEREQSLPGNSFVQSIRRKAMKHFLALGIPSKKNEEYKYSNAQPLFSEEFNLSVENPKNIAVDQFQVAGLNASTIVVINGIFSKELSSIKDLPNGVVVTSLANAFDKHPSILEKHYSVYADDSADAFVALNTAFASDGVVVVVPDNTVVEGVLHIINISISKESSLLFQRNLFLIGKNSTLQIVESFVGNETAGKVIADSVTEIFVGENSRLQYYLLQNEGNKTSRVNAISARQEKNSHFDTNTVTLSGAWLRNNLCIAPEGENCETHLNGLFITDGAEHVDNHTLVDHRKPHCESNQLYKGILGGKSTGVFNGKIFVRPDAQKTNAYQSSKNILLTDDASINTKPQLEIYADDVKCSHGSTIGQLNDEALFYLRSRGLGPDSARSLLLYAFAYDVLETVRIEALKGHLDELVKKKLEH